MLVGVVGSVWAARPFMGKFMLRVREKAEEWEPFESYEPSPDDYDALAVDLPPVPLGDATAVQILLASPAVSRAFYGGQRTGKTNLASVVSKQLTQQGWNIYNLNLGAYLDGDVDEDGHYWSHAVMSVKADLLSATPEEAKSAVADALTVIDEFVKGSGKCLLIVDEWKFISSKDNQYADLLAPLMQRLSGQIAGLDSNGVKRHKTIWTIAPGIVASAMALEGKAVKNLAPVLVAIAPGKAVNWDGQEISFSYPCFDQVNNNLGVAIPLPVGQFESDRICFIDGEWRALGGAELSADLPKSQSPLASYNVPYTMPAKYQAAAVEQQLYPGLETFIDWLKEKRGTTINYSLFHGANRFKSTGRTKEQYLEYCDAAVMKGLLTPQGEDRFFVLK